MKIVHLMWLSIWGCLLSVQAFSEPAQIDYVHVPPGFDDNDKIEVTIDGYLHDCQRLSNAEVDIDQDAHRITIVQKTRPVDPCLFPIVPFNSTVTVANALPQGIYTIVAGSVERTFEVTAATVGAVDEHPYAPLDSVNIEQDPVNKKFYAVLRGRWQVSCMEFDGTILPKKKRSVIEILPKVRIDESIECNQVETDFVKRVELPGLVPGHYLVHVRSMSGTSFNLLHVIYRMN